MVGCLGYMFILSLVGTSSTNGIHCDSHQLVQYRLTFIADWSEEKFPKQYPQFRPHAQWSKLIGRTHNSDYNLWSLGNVASNAFKKFVQDACTDDLEKRETQGFNGIFDTFIGPSMNAGVGESSVDIFVSYDHSMVSAAVRLIPSPDWFVGLNGLKLCPNGTWIYDTIIALDPIDAGTDRGYTFTSPKWASRPRQPMHEITSRFPNHRANSFYYPELDQLPHIAYIKFELLTTNKLHKVHRRVSHEREMKDELDDEDPDKKREELEEQQILHGEPLVPNDQGGTRSLIPPQNNPKNLPTSNLLETNQISKLNEIDDSDDDDSDDMQVTTQAPPKLKTKGGRSINLNRMNAGKSSRNTNQTPSNDAVWTRATNYHYPINTQQQQHRSHARKPYVDEKQDCVVGSWGPWSECSKTCGIGAQKRLRKVLQAPKNGRPCPALEQEKWCGSMRSCRDEQKLFSWLQNGNANGNGDKRKKAKA